MIKSKKGETVIYGDIAEMLSDVACIIGTLHLKTDIPEELIEEAVGDGIKISKIIKNGGEAEDFFENKEHGGYEVDI